MTTASTLYGTVRDAWVSVPPPPVEDLQYMSWGWGDDAWRAFVGIAPVDVDIRSRGFFAATPLLDLPPRTAAAYLGTYLLSLLRSVEQQKAIGIYFDVSTRSHTLNCLTSPNFWERVIRRFLTPKRRDVLSQVIAFLASEHEALALTPEQVDTMLALAAEP